MHDLVNKVITAGSVRDARSYTPLIYLLDRFSHAVTTAVLAQLDEFTEVLNDRDSRVIMTETGAVKLAERFC